MQNAPQSVDAKILDVPGRDRDKKLLYVSGQYSKRRQRLRLRQRQTGGKLSGFDTPYGQCVDAKGDVWITNYSDQPSSSMRTAALRPSRRCRRMETASDARFRQTEISRSPTSGSLQSNKCAIVFKSASGEPSEYVSSMCSNMQPPGYDASGNLYVEVGASPRVRPYANFRGGGSSLRAVTFSAYATGRSRYVGWKYLTLTEQVSSSHESQTRSTR